MAGNTRIVRGGRVNAASPRPVTISPTSRSSETGTIQVDSLDISIIKLEGAEVLRPIPVQASRVENAVVASFGLANINASGDTWQEAITNLKDLIVSVFDLLASHPLERLGPAPLKQLAVLRSFIRTPQDAH
jgi:hypothetical protein